MIKATPEGAVGDAKRLQATVLILVLFNCSFMGVIFPPVLLL